MKTFESVQYLLIFSVLQLQFLDASAEGNAFDENVCNNFALAGEPKNITCPLLFNSSCALEEGDWVLWRVYRVGVEVLEKYYNSSSDIVAPNLMFLNDDNFFVSENHDLVISSSVEATLHSNISCTVFSNSSRINKNLCAETFLNLKIVSQPSPSGVMILQVLTEKEDRVPYVGTTLVACFSGRFQQGSETMFEWSIDRNVSHIYLDPRELVTDTMETCHQPPGWHFDCNCLRDRFPTFETVRKVSASSKSRYKTYEMIFYDDTISPEEDAVQREKCLPFPDMFVTILVVDNITTEDRFTATMSASIINGVPQTRTFNITPVYLQVPPVIIPFQSPVYSVKEEANLLLECEGSALSGNTTLLWRKVVEESLNGTHIDYQPNITTSLNVSVICDMYSMGMPSVFAVVREKSFRPQFSRNPDENGALVLFLRVGLVICNSVLSQTGTYECLSSDAASESTIRSIIVRVDQTESLFVAIPIIIVCVLLTVLVAIVIVILLSVCVKYRSIKNCPLPMWPEEPNSPLVQRPASPLVPNLPFPVVQNEKLEDPYEFPREKLQLGSILGEGQFGVVHQAIADGICSFDSGRQIVAVKTLKRNARPSDIIDLYSELDTMRKMEPHPNIINFLGVCSKPENQPLYILMEFAMFGSLKEYLKTVRAMKRRSSVAAPESSYSGNHLCPYHYQQVLSFTKNHLYKNEQESKADTKGNCFNPQSLPSPTHSGAVVEPAVFAHITRVMKLLSSDYFYSSANVPAIEIASPSPEPDSITHSAQPVSIGVPSSSAGSSVYSFDRLSSSSCAYRECPEGSYTSYSKLSPDTYYNTAYDHLRPGRKLSDVSATTSLLYPPSYVNVPKVCKCHAESADVSSCDSHMVSESLDSTQPEPKSRKLSTINYCVYCAQLNRSSYRNINSNERLDQVGNGDCCTAGHGLDGKGENGDSNTVGNSGELSYFEFVDFAHQIARGMEHLERMKCVHRDLAARNVLIAEGFLLKIGDFGLARDLHEKDYYRKITSGRIPARWMAPESLEERKHTSKSDVWSYGVVLWEILTYGEFPYGKSLFANSTESLARYLSLGHRLPQPVTCSNQTYDLLKMCWDQDPKRRPAFGHLVTFFANLLQSSSEYLNLTVVEARHQPSAGHLEASALAGLGQFSQLDETDSVTSDECSCSPDPDDIDQDDIARNTNTTSIRNENIPMQMLCTSHGIFRARSSSNLDSEGYLKLRMSTEILDSKVQQPNNSTPDKISLSPSTGDTCHMTREERIPTLETFEDSYPTGTVQTTTEHGSHETKL